MFLRGSCRVFFAAACLLCALPCAGQEPIARREQHAWGKFPIGSWKTVQVITESLDVHGNVTNITSTQTRTTLVETNEDTYTLRVDVTVEVSGKRFPTQTQIVKQGYWGESAGQPTTVKSAGASEVVINGRRVPTELQQITIASDEVDVESKVHYSADTPPYQLSRETTTTHRADSKSSATTVETVALELPHKVLGEMKTAAVVKTVRKHGKGTGVTIEVHCDDVPGGVVSHAAAEHTLEGEVSRRSTLQIMDYSIGVGQIEEPSSVVRRRKFHRSRRRVEEYIVPPQR